MDYFIPIRFLEVNIFIGSARHSVTVYRAPTTTNYQLCVGHPYGTLDFKDSPSPGTSSPHRGSAYRASLRSPILGS
jgi:hypothetical protein